MPKKNERRIIPTQLGKRLNSLTNADCCNIAAMKLILGYVLRGEEQALLGELVGRLCPTTTISSSSYRTTENGCTTRKQFNKVSNMVPGIFMSAALIAAEIL